MREVSELAELVNIIDSNNSARVIGIVGAPGSGKSTITSNLSDSLQRENMVIPMDGFHYSQSKLRELGRRDRMGAPDTFEAEALAQRLKAVAKRDEVVTFPDFDRTIEERIVPDSILLQPTMDLVLLEGNYLLYDKDGWENLQGLIDFSIFIETPEEIRLQRLLDRHVRFGKTPEFAKEWMEKVDNPNAEKINTTKHLADVVFHYS